MTRREGQQMIWSLFCGRAHVFRSLSALISVCGSAHRELDAPQIAKPYLERPCSTCRRVWAKANKPSPC